MLEQPHAIVIRILRAREGSSDSPVSASCSTTVFSAHAEVVPPVESFALLEAGILRARGGSSAISDYPEPVYEYSPRTRR